MEEEYDAVAEMEEIADHLYGLDEHFDALFELLVQKGIVTKEEFTKKLEEVQLRNDKE